MAWGFICSLSSFGRNKNELVDLVLENWICVCYSWKIPLRLVLLFSICVVSYSSILLLVASFALFILLFCCCYFPFNPALILLILSQGSIKNNLSTSQR
uniref:Putative ovule protein n=1 Tax=Solanum chacoense TaxID=4108 RepID=A0A0V0H161_SOLCH